MTVPGERPAARSTQTIGELAHVIVAELSLMDLPILSFASDAYYGSAATRGRMASAVVRRSRWQAPVSFDASLGSMVVQTVLVVLNGMATGALGTDGDAVIEGWGARGLWRRRRLARGLARACAALGAATAVPSLPAERAAVMAAQSRAIAIDAGLTEPEANRLAALVSQALVRSV